MEKIKVSKEVAEAIDALRKYATDYEILQSVAHREAGSCIAVLYCAFDDMNDLMYALVVGYEVEKTPGEILKMEYDAAIRDIKDVKKSAVMQGNQGFINGMKFTLQALNIRVEGIPHEM